MQVDWIDHVKERNGKKIGKWRIWTCNHFPLDFRCFVDEIVHHLTKRISTARFCASDQTFSLLVLRSSSESTKKLWIIKSSSMPQNMTLQTRHCWNLQDRAPCRHFNILIVLQIVSCQTINCFIFFFFSTTNTTVFQTTNEKGSQCFVRCQGCTKFSHANNTDSIVCQQMKEMKHFEHRLDEKQDKLFKNSCWRGVFFANTGHRFSAPWSPIALPIYKRNMISTQNHLFQKTRYSPSRSRTRRKRLFTKALQMLNTPSSCRALPANSSPCENMHRSWCFVETNANQTDSVLGEEHLHREGSAKLLLPSHQSYSLLQQTVTSINHLLLDTSDLHPTFSFWSVLLSTISWERIWTPLFPMLFPVFIKTFWFQCHAFWWTRTNHANQDKSMMACSSEHLTAESFLGSPSCFLLKRDLCREVQQETRTAFIFQTSKR